MLNCSVFVVTDWFPYDAEPQTGDSVVHQTQLLQLVHVQPVLSLTSPLIILTSGPQAIAMIVFRKRAMDSFGVCTYLSIETAGRIATYV